MAVSFRHDMIRAAVAEAFGMTPGDLTQRRRPQPVIRARAAAAWIARIAYDESWASVARLMDRSDHTTAMRAVANATKWAQRDAVFARTLGNALGILVDPAKLRPLLPPACGTFALAVIDSRPMDYLPAYRHDDDLCVAEGCGRPRSEHVQEQQRAA